MEQRSITLLFFTEGSALTKACSTLDAEAVKNLLEENASIDVSGDNGRGLCD